MRGLMALVVGMGVLIVVGLATIGVTILRRVSAGDSGGGTVVLDQPEGTRIAGVSALGPRIVVVLQGGGPDRVVAIDPGGLRQTTLARLRK